MSDEILQSDEGNKIIRYVSPIYNDSYVWLWLFEVIGRELDDLQKWTDETREQAFPQLTTWAIEYFEMQYDITPRIGASIEERRRTIISKINSRAPMNPAKMEQMINAATNRKVKVNERTAKRTFEVVININSEGAPTLDMDNVISLIDRVKPAHLLYNIIICTSVTLAIRTDPRGWIFGYPLCGTKPDLNTLGVIQGEGIILDASLDGNEFEYVMTGMGTTGEEPDINISGSINSSSILPGISAAGSPFNYELCGDADNDL